MRLVGLTGGIACGKSTVAKQLQEEGITVIDCDALAHAVERRGRWGWRRIVGAFGQSVLRPDGELDRDKLGAIVFADAAKRRKLNAATHLPIGLELLKQVLWCWLTCKHVVVVDMPLLFETGMHKLVSHVVVVMVDPQTQVRRLMARDGVEESAAASRIASQMPLESKAARASQVIDNSGSPEATRSQIAKLATGLKTTGRFRAALTSPPAVVAAAIALSKLPF